MVGGNMDKAVKASAAGDSVHPHRKEIARYLLSRGLDDQSLAPSALALNAAATARKTIPFPDGLAPQPAPAPAGFPIRRYRQPTLW
jgi:hypothetical protein